MSEPAKTAPAVEVRAAGLGLQAWRRFRANRPAVAGAAALALMLGGCLVGLFYSLGVGEGGRARYEAQSPGRYVGKNPELAAPEFPRGGFSAENPFGVNARGEPVHLLGSDALGRDYLARLLYGGVVSLSIGFAAAVAAAVIGTLYGAIAGYVGGAVDDFLMRAVEILYSLPYMLLVILTFFLLDGAFSSAAGAMSAGRVEAAQAAAAAEGRTFDPDHDVAPAGTVESALGNPGFRSILAMFVAVAAFNWMTEARVVRGQILQLKSMPYVEAARALGAPAWRILLLHMLPNTLGPIIVVAGLMVPQAILLESFLSFLGIGIQEPQVTWGLMAADSVKTINTVQNYWWLLVPPCAALAVTLLALNFVGDGLRDAFDPQSKR